MLPDGQELENLDSFLNMRLQKRHEKACPNKGSIAAPKMHSTFELGIRDFDGIRTGKDFSHEEKTLLFPSSLGDYHSPFGLRGGRQFR
jgi:hypothetical protein